MTPTMDMELTFEVLTILSALAIFIERALSLIFEHRLFVHYFQNKGLKEAIAFGVSFLVVKHWNFDAIGLSFHEEASTLGFVLTAAIIAGGSKASITLFRDFFKIKSRAFQEMETNGKNDSSGK